VFASRGIPQGCGGMASRSSDASRCLRHAVFEDKQVPSFAWQLSAVVVAAVLVFLFALDAQGRTVFWLLNQIKQDWASNEFPLLA
jgi:hypothetical protein